jgi:hypothetical protein
MKPKPDYSGSPVLTAYPNTDVSSAAALARLVIEKCVWFTPVGKTKPMVDRGYRGEMEAFAIAIREGGDVRCNGRVALADTVMALAANSAMRTREKVVFKKEWYEPNSPETPDLKPGTNLAKTG